MSLWRQDLVPRLEPLKLRPEREAEIVEELSQHLDDRVRDLVATGSTVEVARLTALADLDVPGALAEHLAAIEARRPLQLPAPGAPSRGRWFAALLQDLKYAVASLRRTPAHTLTVVASLALTIGPTTAILSIGNWLIWRPPPGVVEPGRLGVVWFGEWHGEGSVSPHGVSAPNLADLEKGSPNIAGVAGWQESNVSLAAEGVVPQRIGSAHATTDFFELLGIRVEHGRGFAPEDDEPPFGAAVTVIGAKLARTIFGSGSAAPGKELTLNGRRMKVIGVLPEGFVGASPFSIVDVWFPSWTYYYVNHFNEKAMKSRVGRSDGAFYTFLVRLKPGSTFTGLQAELDATVPGLATKYPEDNQAFTTTRARVFPGLGATELRRREFSDLVRQLLIVGGVLLLLGCANVSSLLISRGVRRQRERAVRVALGASRWRLVQLMLVESCVLAVVGATAGVGLAVWVKGLIQTLLLPGVSGAAQYLVPLDQRVLLATLGISIACGLLAGVVPALIGSSSRLGKALGRADLRTSTGGSRIRGAFAVTQLALSLALVTNALLFVVTLRNLSAVDVGYDAAGVSIHNLSLTSHGYDQHRAMTFNRELLDRLSSPGPKTPGSSALEHVSIATGYPPRPSFGTRIHDPRGDEKARIEVREMFISDGYFETVRMQLVAGRSFTRTEAMTPSSFEGAPAVISQGLARLLFGESNPLGGRIRIPATRSDPAHSMVVMGVAKDVRSAVTNRDEPIIYAPFWYGAAYSATRPIILVRSRLAPLEAGKVVQSHATAIDSALPFSPPVTLVQVMERSVANRRVFAWVLSMLGALGFLLAAVGLFGLLAQTVAERTREFGIRMAIGAERSDIFRLILKQAAWIAAFGCVAGLGLAALGSRMVETQLVGVTRLDPSVYGISGLALAAIVFIASVWPARSATRIEPAIALRIE